MKTSGRLLEFKKSDEPLEWQKKCREKLKELFDSDSNLSERVINTHHTTTADYGKVHSLVMQVDETLSIPAYLFIPHITKSENPVIAIQGQSTLGAELCRAGFVTLVPETREFSDTIQDLYAWASYVCDFTKQQNYSVAGISHGSDLALVLSALDERANSVFVSGVQGSLHCVPNIMLYMDKKEISSCIAPRSLCLHYNEHDAPSPESLSTTYNGVRRFYSILGAANKLQLAISPKLDDEMDNSVLIDYMQGNEIRNILKMEDIFKKKLKERTVKPYEFCNPISGHGASASPFVIYLKNWYYGTCTYNKNITIFKARHLQDLFNTSPITVFNTHEAVNAPKIYLLDGIWYIYYVSEGKCHVLQGGTDPNDPLNAPYEYKAELGDCIDASVITINDKQYLLSTYQKSIMITEMSNPYSLNGEKPNVILLDTVENSQALYKNGKVMIVYSASDCLGMLTHNGGDPLSQLSWDISPEPVFKGASHACFTTSLDYKEDWIVYHAKVYNTNVGNIRAQMFTWNTNDTPNFGEPVATGEPVREPSATKYGRVVCEVEGGTVGGKAKIVDDALSSGGKKVAINDIGDFVEVSVYIYTAGYHNLTIQYHNNTEDTQYKSLYINDEFIKQLEFPSHMPMTNQRHTVTVCLKERMNSFKIIRDASDSSSTDIDCLVIEPV